MTFDIVDGEVVLYDCDNVDEQAIEYRYLLSEAIAGKRCWLACPDVNAYNRALWRVIKLCERIGLVYSAKRVMHESGFLRIGDEGGIGFYVAGLSRPGRWPECL